MVLFIRRILLIPVLIICWIFGPFFMLIDWLTQMEDPKETLRDVVSFTKNAWRSK